MNSLRTCNQIQEVVEIGDSVLFLDHGTPWLGFGLSSLATKTEKGHFLMQCTLTVVQLAQ